MKVADILLTANDLREMLHLPEGTEVIGCRDAAGLGTIVLRVSHPDLGYVGEGQVVPRVNPTVSYTVHEAREYHFDGWGQ